MPSLSDIQRVVARTLLAGPEANAVAESWFHAMGAARGLRVHRNTVIGACWNALRISYPALERWLGDTAFEALAADFARAHPPVTPALSSYGEAFAAFVAGHANAESRAVIDAIAGYDWLFERVAQSAPGFGGSTGIALEAGALGGVRLHLASSLRLHRCAWPVDAWREQLLNSPDVATLHAQGQESVHLALWRTEQGVAVKRLHAPAFSVIAALLRDGSMSDALQIATRCSEPEECADANALAAILEHDILRAGFARISTPESST